jgi:predicted dehydrogenase
MPPSQLHYDQWLGPSPLHPYSPQYFGGSSGFNCLFWNMYRDFGVGQMGDMGAHTMDLVWNVVDAGGPVAIEVDAEVSDKYNPDICPVALKVSFVARTGDARVVSGRVEAAFAPRLYRP